MKLWQRVLLVIVSLSTAYALWRFPMTGIGTVVVGAFAVWLGRSVYRNRLATNPAGESRDYSLRPGITAIAKSMGLFAAAMLLALLGAYAVRLKYIPDTWLGALIVLGPVVLLLGIAAIYLFMGVAKIIYGGNPRRIGSGDA